MSSFIIVTSIFEPTEAVKKFSKLKNYKLIVVGDKKSPLQWKCSSTRFLSVEDQLSKPFELIKVLPFNHYCRKMVGYLEAISMGATVIIDTDDDNIPKDDWDFPDFEGNFQSIQESQGFVNIYQLFSKQHIWPRGLPLSLIRENFDLEVKLSKKSSKVGVWQGLADEDPDVDAIYRLIYDQECFFSDRDPVVLDKGSITPFNSQNTSFRKELFPLLYLPTYVTFRFTDILRGLVAQPIMWLYDYKLGFTKATVIQKRNPHDYMKDFISEIPMYVHTDEVIEIVQGSISRNLSVSENLLEAYRALERQGIVNSSELITLNAWLQDLHMLGL